MPLAPSSVTRSVDPNGDAIATFDNGLGEKVQAAALVDGNGDHIGITGNPLQVGGTVEVGTFPSEYALPAAQVTALTPQTNALTDTELRASPVGVEASSLPLPSGAATETTLAAVLAELEQKTEPTDTQPISAASLPLPTGASTSALQSTANTALAAIQAATAQHAFGINDVDTASATVTYVGKSDKDGVWCVQKINTASGVSVGWASVTNNVGYLTYSAAWAARASLTFGRYDEAF